MFVYKHWYKCRKSKLQLSVAIERLNCIHLNIIMKIILVSLLVFAGLFALAYSADCDLDGHKFNKGETYSKKGECTQYTCGGPGSFSAKTCAESAAPPTCKEIPQDNSKPYPECCKRYDC